MNHQKTKISVLLLFIFGLVGNPIVAETHLKGEIGDKEFTAAGNPHVVDSVLTVAKGSTVIIKEGVCFIFKPYTGLDVFGNIVVEGTKEKPVAFSSINDAEYSDFAESFPGAFDWNGISIENREGKATFKNFKVSYSIYGIKSKNKQVVIHNGMFSQNGQFNFTIHDKVIKVPNNLVFFYNSEPEKVVLAKPVQDTIINTPRDPKKIRRIIGAIGAGAGLVACGVGSYYAYDAGQQYDDYDETSYANYARRVAEYGKYEDARTYSIISLPTGITFVLAGAATFFFDEILYGFRALRDKRKSKSTIKVSGVPTFQGGAVVLTLSF